MAPPLRLTRRGRLLLTVVVVAVFVGILSPWGTASAVVDVFGGPAPATVTVAPGDTLWSIAERVAPAEDPRDVVMHLRHHNSLPGSGVRAGQELLIPTQHDPPTR